RAAASTEADIAAINEGQKRKARDKSGVLETRVLLPSYEYQKDRGTTADEAKSVHSLEYSLARSYYGMTEWAGLYGFLLEKVTGQPYEEMRIIQDAGRMTRANRRFWDLGIGELGYERCEVERRFLLKLNRYQ